MQTRVTAKGSMTVYLALSLVLILSLLMTLLESARMRGLRVDGNRMAQTGVESVFAEYCRPLLEDYDVLALDGAYGNEGFSVDQVTSRLDGFLATNAQIGGSVLGKRADLYPMSEDHSELTAYSLLTDGNGAAYYNMAGEYMKGALPIHAAKKLYQSYTEQSQESQSESLDEKWEAAKNAVDAVDSGEGLGEEENSEITDEEKEAAAAVTDEKKGILDQVTEWKNKGILALVMEDSSSVSEKTISTKNVVSKRTLEQGTADTPTRNSGWYSKLLFQAYLEEKFSSYGEVIEGHILDYELEYCYAGKDSDVKNLTSVAETLLAAREAANFAYLLTDKEKVQEARVVAIAIAGLLAMPAIVTAIEIGVLIAWAFIESVQDVRSLFSGGKVPLIKSQATWKTALTSESQSSGSSEKGLTYAEYLQLLLYGKKATGLTMRSLDLVELNVQSQTYYGNVKMDHCIVQADWEVQWKAGTMFLNMFGAVTEKYGDGYEFVSTGTYGYE